MEGRERAATAVRRGMAPVLNERPGLAWTAVGCIFLLLILWGATHALRVAWGIALLGALIAAGVVASRRETRREFPVPPASPTGASAPRRYDDVHRPTHSDGARVA